MNADGWYACVWTNFNSYTDPTPSDMLMILLLDQHAAYITIGRPLGSISRFASKFRTGNHNLKIETGRFRIPKTPEDLWICDHCNQNSVENELLILFHCDQYNDLRKTLFIKINGRNTLFTNYNIHDKVCFLFNNTDSHISRLAANFIFQAFERRKKHS